MIIIDVKSHDGNTLALHSCGNVRAIKGHGGEQSP